MDFWIPKHKWQLVDWLADHYKEPKAKFNRMAKKQLYAIYFKTRGKETGR
jgi:3-methyladenine DNA glycosylase AlkD